jgi:NADPH2:quinone reductase
MILSAVRALGALAWGQTGDPGKVGALLAAGADRAVVSDGPGLLEATVGLAPTVVFDPLGGSFTGAAVEALEPRGRLVLFGTSAGPTGEVPLQVLYRKALRLLTFSGTIEPDEVMAAGISAALGGLAAGTLRVTVDEVLPLAAVNEALARLEGPGRVGKILLRLS